MVTYDGAELQLHRQTLQSDRIYLAIAFGDLRACCFRVPIAAAMTNLDLLTQELYDLVVF